MYELTQSRTYIVTSVQLSEGTKLLLVSVSKLLLISLPVFHGQCNLCWGVWSSAL